MMLLINNLDRCQVNFWVGKFGFTNSLVATIGIKQAWTNQVANTCLFKACFFNDFFIVNTQRKLIL